MRKVTMTRRPPAAVLALLACTSGLACAFGLAACGSSGPAVKHLTLVADSTLQAAYAKLIPAFEATPQGKGVSFSESYLPSQAQGAAVGSARHANVVSLAAEPEMQQLVDAGLVSPNWNRNANHGFVADSVVAIILRSHDPLHIHGWADLLKPGVRVLTASPFASTLARWSVLASYGAQLKEGDTETQAESYLEELLDHVTSAGTQGGALQTFLKGTGDALLAPENEAVAAYEKQAAISYLPPRATILIQYPIAVLGTGPSAAEAQKFVNYLLSPAAQEIWASAGYRPLSAQLAATKFLMPADLFTIESLGGWKALTTRFFAPQTGVVARIERSLGASTAK
jgi:ABC-type sulfate transport system substrate-binding protein